MQRVCMHAAAQAGGRVNVEAQCIRISVRVIRNYKEPAKAAALAAPTARASALRLALHHLRVH